MCEFFQSIQGNKKIRNLILRYIETCLCPIHFPQPLHTDKQTFIRIYKKKIHCVFLFIFIIFLILNFSRGEEYKQHVKCITEKEKYGGKNYQPKPSSNKGEIKQEKWIEVSVDFVFVKRIVLCAFYIFKVNNSCYIIKVFIIMVFLNK